MAAKGNRFGIVIFGRMAHDEMTPHEIFPLIQIGREPTTAKPPL